MGCISEAEKKLFSSKSKQEHSRKLVIFGNKRHGVTLEQNDRIRIRVSDEKSDAKFKELF